MWIGRLRSRDVGGCWVEVRGRQSRGIWTEGVYKEFTGRVFVNLLGYVHGEHVPEMRRDESEEMVEREKGWRRECVSAKESRQPTTCDYITRFILHSRGVSHIQDMVLPSSSA